MELRTGMVARHYFTREWITRRAQELQSLSESILEAAIATVDAKCLDAHCVGREAWEKEIDERVAALYGIDLNDIEKTSK